MENRGRWRMLCWAVRVLSCLATVGIVALALFWVLERGLSSVYGDTGMVRLMGRQLSLSVLLMLALLMLAGLMSKRVMNTESWREAMRWTAACAWQGVKAGLIVFVAMASGTMIVMGLVH